VDPATKRELKRSVEKTRDHTAHGEACAAAKNSKGRILLVDDEPAILLTLRAILEMNGFGVDIASSAREANHKLKHDVFDIVISDMRMETETAGYDVVRAARRQSYSPATALLTAYPSLDTQWRENGAQSLWIKPMNTGELLRCIDALLVANQTEKIRTAQGQAQATEPHGSITGSRVVSDAKQNTAGRTGHSSTLTWIHLSDLHMERSDLFNRQVVLEALWRDIRSLVANGLQPDFVAFTGDLAFGGGADEYEIAVSEFIEPLLANAKVSRDRLFMVPGNHDVDRFQVSMLNNPISSIRTQDDVRRLLEMPDARQLMLTPLSKYIEFVKRHLPHLSDSPAFAYKQTLEKDGHTISIVGLNSAWLSGFHKEADGTVNDFGQLAIGEFQARGALPAVGDLTIVLMHHPFDWSMQLERQTVEEFLLGASDLVLRGHLHVPDVLRVSSLAGDCVVIPAGSIFDKRNSPNAYNVVQFDLKTRTGVVWLRRYNNRHNEWQKDLESTGEAADGHVNFAVTKRQVSRGGDEIELGEDWKLDIKNYACTFTEECRVDMKNLGLTKKGVLALVQNEFTSHVNYFRFDLEDYPLPVRTNYIIFLNKVGKRIEFRKLARCSHNEARIASWNDILALYRRATRLSYREDPSRLVYTRGMPERVASLHVDLQQRLHKHFQQFDGINYLGEAPESGSSRHGAGKRSSSQRAAEELRFHLLESQRELKESHKILEAVELGDIADNKAVGLMVACFETSLQHIHKIILRYSPVV
jgi:DNA-binding response OmpR family regulator